MIRWRPLCLMSLLLAAGGAVQAAGTAATGSQATGSQATGSQATETQVAGNQATETQVASNQASGGAAVGDPAAGKAKSGTCVACHGADGISIAPMYPNLKGQHAQYAAKQLRDFKSGARKDPVMSPMAAPLSDQDILDLAAYYASLK